jgi:uracil-DNA glycosylase family 4
MFFDIEDVTREDFFEECQKCKRGGFKQVKGGNGRIPLLIVEDSPCAMQNKKEKLLVKTDHTALINDLLASKNMLLRDVTYATAVRCYDRKGIKPQEVKYCKAHLKQIIEEVKPKVILCFGEYSFKAVLSLGEYKSTFGMVEKWYGEVIPDQKLKCYVAPILSVKDYCRESNKQTASVYLNKLIEQFSNAIEYLDEEFVPFGNLNKKVSLLRDEKDVIEYLEGILKDKPRLLSFDYETTGLKPYSDRQKILSISFCFEDEMATAFTYKPVYDELLVKIFTDKHIGKVCANAKFEMSWTRQFFKCNLSPVVWDTMIAKHIIKPTKEGCGLKFQTYASFGIYGYDSSVKAFIGSSKEDKVKYGDNAVNNLRNMSETDLLTYNALDSLFEHRLVMLQYKKMTDLGIPCDKFEEFLL